MVKKIVITFGLILLSGLAYLIVAGSELQEIKTEIDIFASPNEVWNVISDVESWESWSPIIRGSQGVVAVGSEITIAMIGKSDKEEGPIYNPIITDLDEPRLFRWHANMGNDFIFTNIKVIELVESESGTRLIHKEQFKGLLAPIFCGQMEVGVPPMLNSMNQALKDLIEITHEKDITSPLAKDEAL